MKSVGACFVRAHGPDGAKAPVDQLAVVWNWLYLLRDDDPPR